ncbi:hypothetical protein ACHIPZ_23110 [Antrihabitans sp. NCIMB 15449]|uniref:Uncharacterized protein n=1 Tax=Antrihabitans spumae TaxID=3373370 RepID=A0ABW7JST6_9NOCA
MNRYPSLGTGDSGPPADPDPDDPVSGAAAAVCANTMAAQLIAMASTAEKTAEVITRNMLTTI